MAEVNVVSARKAWLSTSMAGIAVAGLSLCIEVIYLVFFAGANLSDDAKQFLVLGAAMFALGAMTSLISLLMVRRIGRNP